MWPKAYKDYKTDESLVKNQVQPGKGIVGCEMHDLNGWGNTLHIPVNKNKKGFFRTMLNALSGKFNKKKGSNDAKR